MGGPCQQWWFSQTLGRVLVLRALVFPGSWEPVRAHCSLSWLAVVCWGRQPLIFPPLTWRWKAHTSVIFWQHANHQDCKWSVGVSSESDVAVLPGLLTVSGLTGLGAGATFLLKLYNKHLQVEEDVGEQHIRSQTNRILLFYAIKWFTDIKYISRSFRSGSLCDFLTRRVHRVHRVHPCRQRSCELFKRPVHERLRAPADDPRLHKRPSWRSDFFASSPSETFL